MKCELAHSATALMRLEGDHRTIERILDTELRNIDLRHDCSDFALVILFRLLREAETRQQ